MERGREVEREGVREVGSEGDKEGKNFEGREGGRQTRRKGVREIIVTVLLYTHSGKHHINIFIECL